MMKNKRENRGLLIAAISLIVNLGLAITKLLISTYTRSIMILGDSYNNFGDAISNVGHLYSFKKSSSKPTKRHPFGYGKVEYIFTILTAFLVVLIGIFFIRDASERFFIPISITYRQRWFYILLVTAIIKFGLAFFYHSQNLKLLSPVVKAMTYDAIQDGFISLITAFSYKWSYLSSFPLDAILAMVLASYMIIQAIILIAEMIRHVIGDNATSTLSYVYKNLTCYTNIKYFNDIKIHQYSKDITYVTATIFIDKEKSTDSIYNEINQLKKFFKIEKNINFYANTVFDNSNINTLDVQNIQQILALNNLFYDVKIENEIVIIEAEINDIDKKKDPEELLKENNTHINFEVRYYK